MDLQGKFRRRGVRLFHSVKTKLLIPLVVLIFISLVLSFMLSYSRMRSAILDQEQVTYRNMESIVRNDLEAVFTSTRMGLASVVNMPEVQQAFAQRDREKLLQLTMPIFAEAKKEGIEQFQFHLAPAISFLRLHQPAKYGDDLSSFRATVVQCNNTKQTVAGLEEGKGGFGFRVVTPVFYQGRHVGSAEYGMGFNNRLLLKWQKQIGGDFFMYPYASSGVAWAKIDKDKPLAGTAEKDELKVPVEEIKAAMSGKGFRTVYLQNGAVAAVIIPVFDYSGKPISYVKANLDRTKVLNELTRVLRDSIIHLVLSVLVMGLIMYLLIGKILKPLDKLTGEIAVVAQGDLTRDFHIQGHDEIARLGQKFNTMLLNFRQLIGETVTVANKLKGSSESLSRSSEETSASVQEATEQIDKLAYSLNDLGNIAQDTAQYSQRVAQAAEEGQQAVQQAINQMTVLHHMVEGLAADTGGLGYKIEDINKFVQLIGDIADQTNLLALNAAIEAARAGEHGQGFSVVAQEVRKLADRSNQAARDVKQIIKEISEQSENVICSMDAGLNEVKTGRALIERTGEKFNHIRDLVDSLVQQSQAVAAASAQANLSGSEIAAATQQQSAAVQQVAGEAHLLNQLSQDLLDQIGKFKSNASADNQPA